ncbi:argonaute-like protein [Russula decolorans]
MSFRAAPPDGNRGRGRGRGRGGSEYGGGSERGGPGGSDYTEHVEATGVKRRKYGNAGRLIKLCSNHVEVKLDQGTLYHYDGMYLSHSTARNYAIIRTLQTEVEGRLAARPGVYDGRKNLFTAFNLEFESDSHEAIPMGNGAQVEGGPPPAEYTVFLTLVRTINPEVLQRFVRGEQTLDNDVLTASMALNIAVRMAPSMRYPSNARSFFTDQEKKTISGGVVLWRGYFQSVRPAINKVLININISTGAMYQPGNLISLCLDFLGRSGQPHALTARRIPERERIRLQNFLKGIKITTPYRTHNPNRQRLVKRLTQESARNLRFEIGDGRTVAVMQYFHDQLNIRLQFPDLICVELASPSGAIIPLECCEVPPGQLVRKEMSRDQIRSILEFSGLPPRYRERRIRDGLGVLQHEQSQYLREFGVHVPTPTRLVELDGRIITAPRLNYNQKSRQPNIRPEGGVWNMREKILSEPVEIPNWLILIYERLPRFRQGSVENMISGFVRGCRVVGITINPEPVFVRWNSGQGDIADQLSAACDECQRKVKAAPTIIVAILPESCNDIYTAIKNFGDVTAGIATQCMKANKCFNANEQYYANITLKVNMKLGGINVEPDPRDVQWLTDPANPTMIMGGDLSHPPPGSRRGPGGYPSYTSLVGSINSTGTKYVSTMGVQDPLHELIEDLENMCMVSVVPRVNPRATLIELNASTYSSNLGNRWASCPSAFYSIAVSNSGFSVRYHVLTCRMSPKMGQCVGDAKGNCRPGTVIDSDVVSPVETDYYLYGHAGLLGTSKPAHYNVLVDENNFTLDGIQSLSYALCHVYARCTRSVSLPAPIYCKFPFRTLLSRLPIYSYAHNVCTRARNHYEPKHGHRLFDSDIVGTEDTHDNENKNEFQSRFQQAHERQASRMYFL